MTRHRIRPATPSRRAQFLLIAVLLAGATGCSAAPVKGEDAGLALQSQVLAVTKAAAAKDPAVTLKLLDELAAKLDSSAMAGDVTFQRHQNIMAAIDALRTELTAHLPAAPVTAAVAAAPADVPAPSADQPDGGPGADAPAPLKAGTAPVAPPLLQAPAPAVQPPAQTSRGNGNGNDNGNGRGNGRG